MTTSRNAEAGSGRVTAAVRLSQAGRDEIDTMAAVEQRTRSQMVRILLAEAVQARRTRRQ